MGGNAFDTLGHLAGYGVGALSALTSIKGGGLQNWLLNRQRAIEDPSIRASLVGSPFSSGMLFQGGGDVAPPGTVPAAGSVAAPDDIRWLQQQAPARRFIPDLPPLPAEQQVQTRAAQGIVSGLQSSDPVVRAQAKIAGKVPLTGEEQDAIVGRGKVLQGGLGPGGTVGIETPGMPITIGSPYSVSPGVAPDEFATYGEAAAAASQRGTGWTVQQTNRGTWKPVQITTPATTPAPSTQAAPAATTPTPATAGAPGQGGAIRAPHATAPVPAATPAATPTPRAAPPPPPLRPGPPVRTGTPTLGAGFKELPSPPPEAPRYPGGPYDPNAVASTPVAPAAPAYPSPAPSPEEDLSAPAGPGFLRRAVALFTPASAQAAETPGWAPPTPAREQVPARVVVAPPGAVPGWGPPPDTAVPIFVAPQQATGIVAPRVVQPQAAGTPGAAVAPEMPAGTAAPPLTRRSYQSASGQQDVYEFEPPSELAADAATAGITDFRTATAEQRAYFNQLVDARGQRKQIATEDIHRLMRGASESEANATDFLMTKRNKLNQFYQEFPDPAERDKFIGWATRPALEYLMYLRDDPRFKQFSDALAPFQDIEKHTKMLDEGGVNITPGNVPTGLEAYPSQFEKRLDDFNFDLNSQIYRQLALRQMPVGEMTPGWVNLVDSYFDRMRTERAAAQDAARATAPRETAATITLAPTTTTTQPPTGGFNVLGDRAAQ